jgi:hypothetical protein
VLSVSIKYAKQRKAFGATIADFGAIQHKLAEIMIRIFVTESMAWRVVGLIEDRMHPGPSNFQSGLSHELRAIEEFAAECSMVKVAAAEMLDYVADEGVQIHGGYGYHQDYAVERVYRDARINRLFEGTSEINRLVITSLLLKRAAAGRLALLQAARALLEPIDLRGERPFEAELALIQGAKKIALLALALADERYGARLEKQQEILMNLSDIIMEVFAMESAWLRSRKLGERNGANAADACAVYLRDAMARIEAAARTVLSACLDGGPLRQQLSRIHLYADHEPVDAIAVRRRIAARLLASERYSA